MLDVLIRPRAQLDIESIYIHLAVVVGKPNVADATVKRIYATIEELSEFPDLGRVLEDPRLVRPYRRMLSGSHWVLYSHNGESLTVWRVIHTRRDIDDYTAIDL